MADFDDLSLFMAGVFTPREPAYRNIIITDRVFLQEADGKRGVANQIFVSIDDRENTEAVLSAIAAIDFPVNVHAEPLRVALDHAIDDLNDMLRYAGYVIAFASLVILLCIANTISMSTHDRTQEIGVLRSLGFERSRIMKLVLSESIALSFLGGALGCITVFLILSFSGQTIAVRGFTVPLFMSPSILAIGIAASFAVGLAGGFLPALRASRIDIVKSLRNVD